MRGTGLAVFGGSFDPVHLGHLIMAQEALVRLPVRSVLFVPARRPAHKRSRALAPVRDRVAMLRLAIRSHPRFSISRMEVERAGVSFTADTLETLAREGAGALYFLMGQDSLEEFGAWRDPDRIARLARLAVVPRGDRGLPRVRSTLRRRVLLLHSPRIGISSREIRRRIRRGLPVRYWIPDPVLDYIARHGLYGSRSRG
jgi:nicotinate-nucleotide adenylyltransferase